MNLSVTNAPFYKQRRIGSLHALSKALGVSCGELAGLAKHANNLYRLAKPIVKPDGSIRNTYDALEPLKAVHQKIKRQILDHVSYPAYLTGSIQGRDYKINAEFHARARIVITEDISGFFPSTAKSHVFNIWYGFFSFSEDVAHCLTQLTTRHDELPQGAITSSFLANLVFWKNEPTLQAKFADQGLIYSRYVDDISVSSRRILTSEEKSDVIRHIYGMLFRYGYQPKRAKQEIATSAKRMAVTKLAINTKPGLDKSMRNRIRAAVHHIEKRMVEGEILPCESASYTKVMGQVLHLKRFHPGKAAPLEKRLLALVGNR